MSIDKLKPYAKTHAIQNAVFVLEWKEQLTEKQIADVKGLATKFRNLGLGETIPMPLLEIKFDKVDAAGKVQSDSGLGGFSFTRQPVAAGPSRSVAIARPHCAIGVPDYTRWDQVFADVKEYLKVVLNEIAPSRPLAAISLQYIDVFTWLDDPDELNLSEVFRANKYVPPVVLEQKNLWHLHQGYKSAQIEEPIQHARVDNINIDVADLPGDKRAIQVTAAHQAILEKPLWQANGKNWDALISLFQNLHINNKQIVMDLLTTEVCDKIGLKKEVK